MIRGRVKLDLKNIGYVRGSLQNKAMRIAINKAAVPVKEAVVSTAPEQFGNLKASIRIKTRYYGKSKTWAAIVGPSNSFSRVRRKPKAVKAKKPNKTLQAVKKRLVSVKKLAGRKVASAVRQAAGRRQTLTSKAGRKLANAIKDFTAVPKPIKKPKKQRRRRKWNGKKVRPARYAHLMEWGSKKLAAKKFLSRALARSKGRFASVLEDKLKSELRALLTK